jgi:transcription antitermination factor NusG
MGDIFTWNIWVIKVNKFDEVERFLDELEEIEEYIYPTVTKEFKLKSGKIKKKRAPLYSGYIFLRYIDTPEIFYKLNIFPFMTTYVGRCTGDDLKLVKQVKETEYLNVVNKKIQVDDIVQVNSGSFKGFVGPVISVMSSDVSVIFQVFGRDVKTTFNKDDVDIVKRVD